MRVLIVLLITGIIDHRNNWILPEYFRLLIFLQSRMDVAQCVVHHQQIDSHHKKRQQLLTVFSTGCPAKADGHLLRFLSVLPSPCSGGTSTQSQNPNRYNITYIKSPKYNARVLYLIRHQDRSSIRSFYLVNQISDLLSISPNDGGLSPDGHFTDLCFSRFFNA